MRMDQSADLLGLSRSFRCFGGALRPLTSHRSRQAFRPLCSAASRHMLATHAGKGRAARRGTSVRRCSPSMAKSHYSRRSTERLLGGAAHHVSKARCNPCRGSKMVSCSRTFNCSSTGNSLTSRHHAPSRPQHGVRTKSNALIHGGDSKAAILSDARANSRSAANTVGSSLLLMVSSRGSSTLLFPRIASVGFGVGCRRSFWYGSISFCVRGV